MSYDAHKNFAASVVATAPSPASSGTSLVVTGGTGTRFPAVPFNATIWPINAQPTAANAEIVRVTNIATDTLTITRAQESSSARTVIIGDQIAATITAKSLTDVETPLGALDLSTSTAGQIIFPATQNASAGANTLDDYEEGTWTPTIGGTGGQSSQSYTVQVGSYIKIGRLVFVQYNITLSAVGTITTTAQIQGLPFTVENVAGTVHGQGLGFWSLMTSSFTYITAIPLLNSTTANLFGAKTAATATLTALVQADFSATTTITGCMMYRATA